MIPVPHDVLDCLSRKFSFEPDTLTKIGGGREDSDGVVYTSYNEPRKRIIKITAHKADDASADFKLSERAKFFAYLGNHQVPVIAPMPNANGNLIESTIDGESRFMAYCYYYLPGETLKPDKWSDDVLTNWGVLIGQTHRHTQEYSVYDGVTEPETGKRFLHWEDEIDGFIDWCADEDVKMVWRSLKQRIAALPKNRQTYGMVQNDPHMENMLIHDNKLSLIDLDVSCCHFFTCDLAIAIQSVLFTLSGGMERPVQDIDALRRFVTRLFEGYRKECDLPDDAPEAVELFIAYRRALLFTVMQDWLKTKSEYNETWKRMTIEQPPVMGRL
jgi:Ser/Thr protein kinase RdoA (MazF antagonist)